MKYISYMEKNALALSQYKKVFSKFAVFVIAIISNRNIRHINLISEKALVSAFNRKSKIVQIKDVFNVMREHLDIVKYNVYHKVQKLFFYMLLLFSIYYVVKIVVDRYSLINHMEAQKSIRIQEKELRGN